MSTPAYLWLEDENGSPILNRRTAKAGEIVHDYASRFPLTEHGDAQLLQGCYDYMDAFKRVMDSTSKVQMDYICL